MPRILHLITGLETGGAERMLARLAARMDHAEFPTTVVSLTEPGALAPVIAAAGVAVHSLGLPRGRPDPRGVVRLVRLVRAFRPDVVQTWLYHADLLGLLACAICRSLGQAPTLAWNVRCSDAAGSAMLRWVLSRASRIPAAVVVNARVGQRYHAGIGYRPRRWVYIPNGFDTTLLRPDPETASGRRAELGIGEAEKAILLPARYDPMKDHASFLAAAALLAAQRRDVRFALAGAGTGADNPALAAAIAAHGLEGRTILLGERGDLDRLYPAFDVVTLSSAYGEGFPNVLGEAMACGVPCVATNVGDSATIIGDAGEIVPPRDPAALAAAWQRIVSLGGEEARALGTRARARIVEHYDLDAVVARYAELYRELAEG